jgi:hypothetical protein
MRNLDLRMAMGGARIPARVSADSGPDAASRMGESPALGKRRGAATIVRGDQDDFPPIRTGLWCSLRGGCPY